MLSTLKPTDLIASAQQEAVRDVHIETPRMENAHVKSAFHQHPADMRDDSGLSVAGADFSAGSLTGTSGSASSTALAERLELATTWFGQACVAQLNEAKRLVGLGADPHATGECGCVDLMEHALAIARVLKIEMPGFMSAMLRPGLADTARKFAKEIANGLDQFVCDLEGERPSRHDYMKVDFFKATKALRSDSPDLNGIWSKNPLFAMNHLDDKTMLLAKIEQYTAKHQAALGK